MAPQVKAKVVKEVKLNDSCYIPKIRKRKMKWENTLSLGLEWELQNMGNCDKRRRIDLTGVDKVLRDNKSKSNPFHYKTDCSVPNGVEFVTQPVTLQYLHNKINLKKVTDYMKKETKFKETSACGIHVHLDKAFFSCLELVKLRLFFSVNGKKLEKFSGRSKNNIDRWARYESGYTVKDFLYHKKTQDEAVKSRRYACSFKTNTGDKTIELRMFASTTNHKRLIAILQFCDAVSYFLRDCSIMAISKKTCWNTFINWCYDQNRYQHLMEDFENVNLAC